MGDRDIQALAAQNWSIKRELGRLVRVLGHAVAALISCGVALFVMLLPVSQARDPWQLFFEGGMGQTAWAVVSVAIAAGMFVIAMKDAGPYPRFRRPK